MGFNLQLGDALRSESVTAIDDAIRAIARQEIDRTPRTKFCDACAYMHQPEISARCCCVACHGDDVPAWAQRMNTPPSIEKTGDASPASEVKACPFGPVEASVERFLRAIEARLDVDDDDAHILSRDGLELLKIAWSNRRTPAPSPATGESAIDKALDPNCWDLAMQADTLAAARAELASLRAEVERLRTALAEKEKAGVNANAVVERCIELVVRKKTPRWDEVSVWCDALRTALGAKETK